MKKYLAVLLVALLFAVGSFQANACSYGYPNVGYTIKNGQVYYPEHGLVLGVDQASFTTKKFDSPYYAADINHVYYKGHVLEGLNPQEAVFLGGLDIEATLAEDGYIKDGRSVFFQGEKIYNADPASFVVVASKNDMRFVGNITQGYAKDKSRVYHHGRQIWEVDPETFSLLSSNYFLDKNGIYYDNERIASSDSSNFEIQGKFLVTNGRVFLGGVFLPYDASSFKALFSYDIFGCRVHAYVGSLIRDKSGVYFLNANQEPIKLDIRDPASLEMLTHDSAKDKYQQYHLHNLSERKPVYITTSPISSESMNTE